MISGLGGSQIYQIVCLCWIDSRVVEDHYQWYRLLEIGPVAVSILTMGLKDRVPYVAIT